MKKYEPIISNTMKKYEPIKVDEYIKDKYFLEYERETGIANHYKDGDFDLISLYTNITHNIKTKNGLTIKINDNDTLIKNRSSKNFDNINIFDYIEKVHEIIKSKIFLIEALFEKVNQLDIINIETEKRIWENKQENMPIIEYSEEYGEIRQCDLDSVYKLKIEEGTKYERVILEIDNCIIDNKEFLAVASVDIEIEDIIIGRMYEVRFRENTKETNEKIDSDLEPNINEKTGSNLEVAMSDSKKKEYFEKIDSVKMFENFKYEDWDKLLTKEVMIPYEKPIKIVSGKKIYFGMLLTTLMDNKHIQNRCSLGLLEKNKVFEYNGIILNAGSMRQARKGYCKEKNKGRDISFYKGIFSTIEP